MNYLFTLIITLFICENSFSQNAEALENWLNSVEKEFKEIDQTSSSSTLRSGTPIYNRVRFNLLSDTYFTPVFGKPFDELSSLKIKFIGKKIQGVRQKKKFGSKYELKYPWARRLDWYLSGAFTQSHQYTIAIKEIEGLRSIKKAYANTVEKLKAGAFDFTNLKNEKKQINSKYAKLIPKEIEFIKSLIDEQEKSTANKALASSIETLNNFDNDYTSLKKVNDLKHRNYGSYKSAELKTKKNFDEQIENKISQILKYASVKETENISSKDIKELNKFSTTFNKKYTLYSARKEIKLVNDQIYETKKTKVVNQFDAIALKINSSQSFGDLNLIRSVYLSLLHQYNDSKIISLSEKIEIRRKEIKNENELLIEQQRNLQETAQGEAMVLNTDGLYLAELYDNMFRGHFENINLTSEDMFFIAIFNGYLKAYGKQCSAYLPENKVDIMDLECAKENVTTNGYGFELSRVCIQWRPIKSGLYARPDLYNAKMEVENFQRKRALQTGIEAFSAPNATGNSLDLFHKTKGLKKDLLEILKLNSCTSNSIRQFEKNLKLFALKKPGIRMQGVSKYIKMKKSGGPTGPQNFAKLIDDLVTDQAETWALYRYSPKSITNANVSTSDKLGRPLSLRASYSFSSFGAVKKGWVTTTFKNGLPDCIYFSDFPENCKTPNSKIVLDYANGEYRE